MNINVEVSSLYGLNIHKYHSAELTLAKNEHPLTLFDIYLKSCKRLEEYILKEIKINENEKDSKILQTMKELLKVTEKLIVNVLEMQKSMNSRLNNQKQKDKDKKNEKDVEIKEELKEEKIEIKDIKETKEQEWEEYYTIENFNFYGRGFAITMIHFVENCNMLIQKKQTSKLPNLSKFLKEMTKFVSKIQAIQALSEAGVIGMKLLEDNHGESPFNDTIDISEFKSLTELNAYEFLRKMGAHYVPKLAKFYEMLIIGTASQQNAHDGGSALASNIFYFFNYKGAAKKSTDFFKSVDAKKGKSLWDIQDSEILKRGVYLGLQKIDTSVTFSISKDDIEKFENETEVWVEKQVYIVENISKKYDSKEEVKEKVEEKEEIKDVKLDKLDFKREIDGNISLKDFQITHKLIKKSLEKIEIQDIHGRLISPYKIDNNIKIKTKDDFPEFKIFERMWAKIIPTEKKDKSMDGCIIFHMHGGGFVSMSSFSHECYLRKWASIIGVPIVSIDYRKAPEYQFPVPFEECFLAYKWLLRTAPIFLNTPLRRIIVAGDSAGGNLSLSLTMRCIEEGIQKPDAIILSYPATYLNSAPSPARLCSLIDPMVNYSFLKMCSDSYIKKGDFGQDGSNNPFISPSLAPNEILKHFPPTYINVGTLDPLLDDAVHIAKRINKNNGGKVYLDVYDGLGHGYLNLVDFVPEADKASKRLCNWILHFFKESFNQKK